MANIEEKGICGRGTAGVEVPSSTPQPSELHTWTPKTALMSQSGHFGSENGHPPSPSFPRTVDLLGLGGGAAGTDGDATAGASNASMEVKLSTVTPSSSTALVAAAAAAADPFAGLALMEVSTSQTLGARGSSWPLYSQGVRCSLGCPQRGWRSHKKKSIHTYIAVVVVIVAVVVVVAIVVAVAVAVVVAVVVVVAVAMVVVVAMVESQCSLVSEHVSLHVSSNHNID